MVNDGIKDGIESTTRRPKPSQGIQSDPLHTDTLSVLSDPTPGLASSLVGEPFSEAPPADPLGTRLTQIRPPINHD